MRFLGASGSLSRKAGILWGAAASILAPAYAQTGEQTVAQSGDQSGFRPVSEASAASDEFVITAERRASPASRLAASITRIDEDAILALGADHPSELLARAPGVLIHRGSGQEHLTAIRSPVLTGGAGAGSFLFLQNGVPLRAAGFANVNGLFEAHTEIADGLEIVRGPSGALYGANAIHGVIDTQTLNLEAGPGGYLEFSDDTIERFKGRGVGRFEHGDHVFGVGFSVLDDPGFRAASGADQQKLSLAHKVRRGKIAVTSRLAAVNLNQETAGFVRGDDAYLDAELRRTNPNPEAFRDVRALRASSRIEIETGAHTSLVITPYGRVTDMDFLLHFLPSRALEENGHWSLGAQTAFYYDGPGRLSVIAGLDVDYTQGFLREFQSRPTVFSFTEGLHYDYDVSSVQLSGFSEARYQLTDRLEARLAARLDWTRYDYQNNTDADTVGRFLRPADRIDHFVTVSPKASLLYNTGPGTVFVSYARGARPPQTTDLYRLQINQSENGADPEFIDAVELGWRTALGPRLRFEAAGYYMEKRNFFFRDADGFNVDNGRTRHLGAEVSLGAELGPTLRLETNASYGAHTYRFSREINSAANPTEAIAFGDEVDTSPNWLAGGRLNWTPQRLPISAQAEWVFVDDYFLDAANSRTYPGHHLVHLRGEWRASERLVLFAALRNVLDKFYAERADFAFGSERYFPGEERTLTVGARLTR